MFNRETFHWVMYTDTINPSKCLRFILIDCVTNTKNSSKEETDDLLLEKETFWIRTIYTMHKGLNDYHDWRRVRRIQKFDIINGNTAIKLAWIFPELDFFSKLKPFSTYLLSGFHMKNKFRPENVLKRKIFLAIILSILLKYMSYVFCCYLLLSLFYHYHCFSNLCHCLYCDH